MFEPYESPVAFKLSDEQPSLLSEPQRIELGNSYDPRKHICRYCGREGASLRSNACHETACPKRCSENTKASA
jgi:hypothetical protein